MSRVSTIVLMFTVDIVFFVVYYYSHILSTIVGSNSNSVLCINFDMSRSTA